MTTHTIIPELTDPIEYGVDALELDDTDQQELEENHFHNPFQVDSYPEEFQDQVKTGQYRWAKYSVILMFVALFFVAAVPSTPVQKEVKATAPLTDWYDVEVTEPQTLEMKTTTIVGKTDKAG